MKESNSLSDKQPRVDDFDIVDIEHEEIQNKRQVDDIALNGAKMLREQLNISDNSKSNFLKIFYKVIKSQFFGNLFYQIGSVLLVQNLLAFFF